MKRITLSLICLSALLLVLGACDTFRQSPTPVAPPTAASIVSAEDDNLKRGDALFAHQSYQAAIDAYSAAIQSSPQNAEAFNNRGLAYFYLGDPAKALADFNQALTLRRDYPNALTNRAIILFNKGNYDDVIRDTSRAVDLDPEADSAYMFLGNAFAREGNYFAAVRNWLRANSIRRARASQ